MRLYKYVTAERKDILANACIRFSQPPALNDPFDLRPVLVSVFDRSFWTGLSSNEEYKVEAGRRFVEEIRKHPLYAGSSEEDLLAYFEKIQPLLIGVVGDFLDTVDDQLLKVVNQSLPDSFLNQLGVLCLAETPDNELMWSHYADSHRGFVIEFDGAHPYFDQRKTSSDDLRLLRKVVYTDKRPALTMMNFNPVDIFLTKGSKWGYEQEWRMVVPLADASKHIVLQPHDVYLFNFPKGVIAGVILGSNASDDLEGDILEILDGSIEYRNVRVQKAVLSSQDYKVAAGPVLRYGPEALKVLLDDLFPAQASLQMESYVGLAADLNMMKFYSLHAVELLLTRYAPLVLDENWRRSLEDSTNTGVGAEGAELHDSEDPPLRSHADIVYEALSLDRGVEWAVYTEIRDRQNEVVAPDVPVDPMQNVLKSFPVQEFTEISRDMLPKVLGITSEQLEELEKKMKEGDNGSQQQ